MAEFNPNDIGMPNGNCFGLPYDENEAEIVILPVPWDVTTSYSDGTSGAPEAIENASLQVDLFDLSYPEAWKIRIATRKTMCDFASENARVRKMAEEVISSLEDGVSPEQLAGKCAEINAASERLNAGVYDNVKDIVSRGKLAAVLGGDHSVPFGAIKAVSEKYGSIGILHIDAHADLRCAYEGFRYSHASIMYNSYTSLPGVTGITQIGVRDFCKDEYDMMQREEGISVFTDRYLSDEEACGRSWMSLCDEIISTLPENVYISFDIDGLSPDNCPNTGTPVPGGLSFNKADFLLRRLALSEKRIVGFDLCEVGVGENSEWDANVGARLLFKLCIYAKINSEK